MERLVVDVHSHIYPRSYIDRLKEESDIPRVVEQDGVELFDIFEFAERGGASGRPMGAEYHQPEAKRQYMAAVGIDVSLISLGNPWVDFMPAAEASRWAARLNEEVERICADSGGSLLGMGTLPMQAPAEACREIDRILELPHLRGVIMGTRAGSAWIDDRVVWPVWDRLEAAGLPVFIHPHYGVGMDAMAGYGSALPLGLGFPFETSVAAVRLILAGVLDRFPQLRLLLAHGGGTLPYLAARLDSTTAPLGRERKLSEVARSFYFDSLVYHLPSLLGLSRFAADGRVMFGTDHPFAVADPRANLAAIDQLGDASRVGEILGTAAAQLFRIQR